MEVTLVVLLGSSTRSPWRRREGLLHAGAGSPPRCFCWSRGRRRPFWLRRAYLLVRFGLLSQVRCDDRLALIWLDGPIVRFCGIACGGSSPRPQDGSLLVAGS